MEKLWLAICRFTRWTREKPDVGWITFTRRAKKREKEKALLLLLLSHLIADEFLGALDLYSFEGGSRMCD